MKTQRLKNLAESLILLGHATRKNKHVFCGAIQLESGELYRVKLIEGNFEAVEIYDSKAYVWTESEILKLVKLAGCNK